MCAVPRCSHWHREETVAEWYGTTAQRFICAACWRRLTRDERRLWARLKRQAAKYGDAAVAERRSRVFEAFVRRLSE